MNPHPLVYETSALARLSYSAFLRSSRQEPEGTIPASGMLVAPASWLLLPAPEPGRPRRNRTPCLSTQLFKVRFRRPMPGTRAFIRYALACRVMPNTNVHCFAGVRSFVCGIARQAKAYRTFSGRGVRQPRASSNSTTQSVRRSAEMSHAPIIRWQ